MISLLAHTTKSVNKACGIHDVMIGIDSNTGVPELVSDLANAYRLDITSTDTSERQCQTATSNHPDGNPITNLHKGLLICVATLGSGMALLEQTQPLAAQKTLQLHEVYWPGSGT